MILTTEHSLEDRKKTRNRIAQRKHCERKCVLLPRAYSGEGFGSTGLRNDSVPGTIGEGVRQRDRSQSFSPISSAWETPWESLAQSFSPKFGMEDHTEFKDQLKYQMTAREENLFFSKIAMDHIGIMTPGLDLPQLTTLEGEWRYSKLSAWTSS